MDRIEARHWPVWQVVVPVITATCLALASGCDDSTSAAADSGAELPDAGARDAGPFAFATTLEHSFPEERVEPGFEDEDRCYSWTLGNETSLFVHSVRSENDGAFHHSNWFAVDEDTYDGPDGVWPCDERGFDTVAAGLDGQVFFAQSTQVRTETQTFPDGAVVEIPPHARIVGHVHLLNTSRETLDTSMRLSLATLDQDEVDVVLAPMAFTNLALEIPARSEIAYSMNCDIGRPQDLRIYFVLPHYHDLGTAFSLEVEGADGTQTVLETNTRIGDPLGQVLDPPPVFRGVERVNMRCDYQNLGDETVRYGFGNGEMCVFLAFTDSRRKIVGVGMNNEPTQPEPGMVRTTCAAISL